MICETHGSWGSARISFSAFLSRGMMEHVKGRGRLAKRIPSGQSLFPTSLKRSQILNLMESPVNGYISFSPSVPSPFLISKTESMDAITINVMVSAKCLPGQIRFPSPKKDAKTGSSRKLPSGFMNRSGLNESGLGYKFGS